MDEQYFSNTGIPCSSFGEKAALDAAHDAMLRSQADLQQSQDNLRNILDRNQYVSHAGGSTGSATPLVGFVFFAVFVVIAISMFMIVTSRVNQVSQPFAQQNVPIQSNSNSVPQQVPGPQPGN